MSRDPGHPAGHPLVELVYDLREAIAEAGQEEPGAATARARLYGAVHGTLRSARRLVDALEVLVVELEAQSAGRAERPPGDGKGDHGDFQRIRVR